MEVASASVQKDLRNPYAPENMTYLYTRLEALQKGQQSTEVLDVLKETIDELRCWSLIQPDFVNAMADLARNSSLSDAEIQEKIIEAKNCIAVQVIILSSSRRIYVSEEEFSLKTISSLQNGIDTLNSFKRLMLQKLVENNDLEFDEEFKDLLDIVNERIDSLEQLLAEEKLNLLAEKRRLFEDPSTAKRLAERELKYYKGTLAARSRFGIWEYELKQFQKIETQLYISWCTKLHTLGYSSDNLDGHKREPFMQMFEEQKYLESALNFISS